LRGRPVSIKRFVGHGCGKIIGKASVWGRELFQAGCKSLLVIHDLDDGNRAELEARLRKAYRSTPISQFVVVIPVQEIEAWLLSDAKAISKFFNLKTELKQIPNPENVRNPKERLGDLIYQSTSGKKRYVNSLHNEKIIQNVSLDRLRTCHSFIPLEHFVREQLR
jgi:Domain of unknown function (DUF4276)